MRCNLACFRDKRKVNRLSEHGCRYTISWDLTVSVLLYHSNDISVGLFHFRIWVNIALSLVLWAGILIRFCLCNLAMGFVMLNCMPIEIWAWLACQPDMSFFSPLNSFITHLSFSNAHSFWRFCELLKFCLPQYLYTFCKYFSPAAISLLLIH